MHNGEVGCRMCRFVCAFGNLSPPTVTDGMVAQDSRAKAQVMVMRAVGALI